MKRWPFGGAILLIFAAFGFWVMSLGINILLVESWIGDDETETASSTIHPTRRPPPPDRFPRAATFMSDPGAWVGSDDYPTAAMREGKEGMSQLSFRVGRDGRITECEAIGSSGSALLDRTACGLVEERGRFYPARDATGRTIAVMKTLRFTWRMPEE